MRVSVVVPVFNVEKYLKRCLDSLVNQTYKAYEIILVDDGSTDGSGIIADHYARNNSSIKVIHKKNAGLGLARNTGIENACGDAIVFLDSDDYYGKELIECLVKEYVKNGADAVIGGYERVRENGSVVGKLQYQYQVFNGDRVKCDFLMKMIGSAPSLSDSVSMAATNTLYNLNLIKQSNIRFVSEREYISEDIVFNIKFYLKAKKVCIIPNTEYKYQITANSLTTSYRGDRYELSKKMYYCICNILQEEGIYDACKYRLMKTMFNYWRMCLAQEKQQISGHSLVEQRAAIYKICDDGLTKEILSEYPINELGRKQQLFLFLVKYKMLNTIIVLIERGFISVG